MMGDTRELAVRNWLRNIEEFYVAGGQGRVLNWFALLETEEVIQDVCAQARDLGVLKRERLIERRLQARERLIEQRLRARRWCADH